MCELTKRKEERKRQGKREVIERQRENDKDQEQVKGFELRTDRWIDR